ncbi:MAG: cation transporter [Bacteroidales bacterium]
MKLQDFSSIINLDFDLVKRTLIISHLEDEALLRNCLESLNLNSELINSETTDQIMQDEASDTFAERKSLLAVLIINFAFFVTEIIAGMISNSVGLVADSLDMLADAFVYGLSLFVVGSNIIRKKRVARFSGYFQITLALLGFIEVLKRALGIEQIPQFQTMIIVSSFALLANAISLYLLQRTNNKEAHIQASVICSSNDIIINAGVILAGFMVWISDSKIPDLIVGTIVFVIVIKGAFRILKLSE